MNTSSSKRRFALLAAAALCACSKESSPAGAATAVAVVVRPSSAQVAAGGSVGFAALVTGTDDTAVAWSLLEASDCGSVTQSGVYTAPGAAASCHVVATSNADATRSGVATVTVSAQPVAVSISPASASIDSCQVLSFSATVTGSGNTAVTWSVEEGSAGGIITADGVYTAPSSAGTYHVVATSQADPTKSAAATVVVTDRILGIAISTPDATVPAGGSVLFTATVTTTCGTFTATRVVTAPK